MAGVPVVDLGGEALPDLFAGPLDSGQELPLKVVQMVGQRVFDGPFGSQFFGTVGQPRLLDRDRGGCGFVRSQRLVVQVRGDAGVVGGPAGAELDECEPFGDGPGRAVPVSDRLGEGDEQPERLAGVVAVDQDRALFEGRPVVLDGDVDDGVQQRVARSDQVGPRPAVQAGVGAVKGDPLAGPGPGRRRAHG